MKEFITRMFLVFMELHAGRHADIDGKTRCSIACLFYFLLQCNRVLLRNCNGYANDIIKSQIRGFKILTGAQTRKSLSSIEVHCSSCSFLRPRTRQEKTWIITWNEKKCRAG